jgi:hypothetical protein
MTMTRRDLTAETAADVTDVEAEAKRRGIDPYKVRAANAVGNRLVRDLVNDFRRPISQSASPIPPAREKSVRPKGSGWQDAQPVSQPPGIGIIDRMCDEDSKRKRVADIRERVESAWVEDHLLERRNPHRAATEYDPFSRERMGFHDDE